MNRDCEVAKGTGNALEIGSFSLQVEMAYMCYIA